MRTGKISENILKRSVIKTIKYKNKECIMTGAKPSGDASVTALGTVIATAVAGNMFDCNKYQEEKFQEMLSFDIKRALESGMNNVAAAGGKPVAVNLALTLPRIFQEQNIKDLMRYISGLCAERELEIAGGHTEVTVNVLSPIITFTVYGEKLGILAETGNSHKIDELQSDSGVSEKLTQSNPAELVMVGDIAMSGTAALVRLEWDKLKERFQKSYLELALKTEESMNISKEAIEAFKCGAGEIHDLSTGGIYSAIWEMSERTGTGVEIYLDKIPIRQETVEMCEVFTLNPYKLMSNGSFICTCEDGDEMVKRLAERDIRAVTVGKLRADNDKVIIKNEEKRYVEPPKGDQLYEFINL